jgi:hypothetical protein
VKLPGGTGNRIEFLTKVGFFTSDEQTAFNSAWGSLSAGSHAGVPEREQARIGLVLALEFGQLIGFAQSTESFLGLISPNTDFPNFQKIAGDKGLRVARPPKRCSKNIKIREGPPWNPNPKFSNFLSARVPSHFGRPPGKTEAKTLPKQISPDSPGWLYEGLGKVALLLDTPSLIQQNSLAETKENEDKERR